jgi:hypothetical protein
MNLFGEIYMPNCPSGDGSFDYANNYSSQHALSYDDDRGKIL